MVNLQENMKELGVYAVKNGSEDGISVRSLSDGSELFGITGWDLSKLRTAEEKWSLVMQKYEEHEKTMQRVQTE